MTLFIGYLDYVDVIRDIITDTIRFQLSIATVILILKALIDYYPIWWTQIAIIVLLTTNTLLDLTIQTFTSFKKSM